MPWQPSSALRFTKRAKSAKSGRQWSAIANSAIKRGDSESSAIRQASGVIKRQTQRAKYGKR